VHDDLTGSAKINLRATVRVLAACCLCQCASGCLGWFEGSEQGYEYILIKGDSENIAKWTMEQTDGWQIKNGLWVLDYRVVQARDDKRARERAIEWYVIALSRIEDWPPDHVFSVYADGRLTTKDLVRLAFILADDNAYNFPVLDALVQRFRPDARHAQWLGDWKASVAWLAWERQEAKDMAAGKLRGPASQPDFA
jgi:hypothetical protein